MDRRAWIAVGVVIGLSGVPFVARPRPLTSQALALVRDLPAGAPLTLEDFAVREVDGTVPATSLLPPGRAAELTGRPLRHALRAGDLIRAVDVGFAPDPVPPGFRLVSLSLAAGRSSGAQRGDRVDVIAVTEGTAHTLIGDVEVRELFGAVDVPSVALLRVRAEDAERLMLATEASKLFLALRSPGDDEAADLTRTITVEQLLRPPPKPRCNFHPLQLIRGGP